MDFSELKELLVAETVYDCLKEREDELFELIPELRVCKGFDQKNDWHVYDVYEHILHVVAGVEPELIVRLTALFHDVGKPPAFTLDEEGVGHFRGHWDHSEALFKQYAPFLDLTEEEITLISNLIFYHDMNVGKMTHSQIAEMAEKIRREHIGKLFAIKRADLLAQASKYHGLLVNIQKQEQAVLADFCTPMGG